MKNQCRMYRNKNSVELLSYEYCRNKNKTNIIVKIIQGLFLKRNCYGIKEQVRVGWVRVG